jgi:hypothetical protein
MRMKADVAVLGGGMAGVAAALASARSGARTLLLEKEYALGGLATLGLIVVYLPLDDGLGVKMSASLSEELLRCPLDIGPGEIPAVWADEQATEEERRGVRYQVTYNAASMMIAAERLLLNAGVKLLYDARLSSAETEGNRVKAVGVETKRGRMEVEAAAFIDCTGDADLCYLAGERTVDDPTNRRTGWYYSYDGEKLRLHQQTDPLHTQIPPGSRLYSGTDPEEITQSLIDQRGMILDHVRALRAGGDPNAYPLLIPAYHGLRMTRRLETGMHFSEDAHDYVWFHDAIGMIGNWKKSGHRYSIPYRAIKAETFANLYAAGRCCCAEKSGWDLTRVIPTCAVTGEAAGLAAAWQAQRGEAPTAGTVQNLVTDQGGLLRPELFDKRM